MSRRLALATLLAVLLSSAIGSRSAADSEYAQRGYSQLKVTPQWGHSGDWVFLSGSGLDPNKHLFVVMACPDFLNQSYGNQEYLENGPTTDGNGEFKGFPFRVLTLRHFPALGCQLYVPVGANPIGPDLVGVFTIFAPNQKLPSCATRICVRLKSRPQRVRAGYVENVRVEGWPGARADVTISYAVGKLQSQHVTLDWQGYGWLRFKVPAGASPPVQARILAHVRMHASGAPIADRTGQATGQFTVVR